MARITVEDCLQKVNNRFTLIHMAANRVRQLRKGAEPKIVSKNKDIVISLREIAAGNVIKEERIDQNHLIETTSEILPDEVAEETDQKASDEVADETDQKASDEIPDEIDQRASDETEKEEEQASEGS